MRQIKVSSRASALIATFALAATTIGCGSSGGGSSVDQPSQPEQKKLTIKRDSYGIPHVYADTVRGLFHGYGYAVAEDRLYQIEMAKRSSYGTVAQVHGAAYADLDVATRKLIDPASIRTQLAALSQEDKDIFQGYAKGFNARIQEAMANKQELMPKQFIDAGFEPVAWTAEDVAMVWVVTMAVRFSNSNSEISNLQLLNDLKTAKGDAVGQQIFEQLRWLEDPTSPTTVPRAAGYTPVQVVQAKSPSIAVAAKASRQSAQLMVAQKQPAKALFAEQQQARLSPVPTALLQEHNALFAAWRGLATPEERPKASNLWILGPSKTSDQSTIFNNGPQFGNFNPSYVYGIGLHGAGFDVTGNTPFANPVILFGTNGDISWGATAGPQDVNDMYEEKINNANEYLFNGTYRPMKKRVEVVKVKGDKDITVEVFSTVHGTVTSMDAAKGTAYSMRRSWDGQEVETLLGWIHSVKAKNWTQWLKQAERVAITINWYYADKLGNIGYVSPGRMPIRPASQDVRLPALGDGSMEWQGFKPFSELPQVYNPSQGYIVNWNNQSGPGVLGDGSNYSLVDRVNEFIYRIDAKPTLTPAETADLTRLTSLSDPNARYFVPYILEATRNLPANDPVKQAAQLLGQWDGLNTNAQDKGVYSEPAATVMRTWLPLVFKQLLADDLPVGVVERYLGAGYPTTAAGSASPAPGSKLLYNALLGAKAGVPQTYDFLNGADKYALIRDTLAQTVTSLTAKYGPDMSQWLTPVTPHTFAVKNFMQYPQAGADETLTLPTYMNRGTENDRITFAAGGAVSMCTVAPPGQSGFVAPNGSKSKHYADQLELYKNFECREESLTPQAVDANRESTKTLSY